MADIELLREFIARCGMSYTNVAKELNLTYVGFNNKMQGRRVFTLKEALKLKKILNLTQSEWNAVFDEVE